MTCLVGIFCCECWWLAVVVAGWLVMAQMHPCTHARTHARTHTSAQEVRP